MRELQLHCSSLLGHGRKFIKRKKGRKWEKELHCREAVIATHMASKARPPEGASATYSDSVMQRKGQMSSEGQNHRYFEACLLGNLM